MEVMSSAAASASKQQSVGKAKGRNPADSSPVQTKVKKQRRVVSSSPGSAQEGARIGGPCRPAGQDAHAAEAITVLDDDDDSFA